MSGGRPGDDCTSRGLPVRCLRNANAGQGKLCDVPCRLLELAAALALVGRFLGLYNT